MWLAVTDAANDREALVHSTSIDYVRDTKNEEEAGTGLAMIKVGLVRMYVNESYADICAVLKGCAYCVKVSGYEKGEGDENGG